ncbi:MAG: SRPBCC family protein [Candidatus Obscuribacterales bacterium]|nr:SRPBCC family protein [Candidatus Obscuribacterales bacterium]
MRSRIKSPAQEVLDWHWRRGTMQKLIPPWETVSVIKEAEGPQNGQRAILRLHIGPAHLDWVAEHCDYIEGMQFADKQISGPFAYWLHTHIFESVSEFECELIDRVEYELALSRVSKLLLGTWTRDKLDRMFRFRHHITKTEIESFRERNNQQV